MGKQKNVVIFACDHNYIWPALLAANSIARYASRLDFDIRIFSCTYIPDGFTERCAKGVTAEILHMGDFSVKTGITERYSMATFLRLFALEKIADNYDRILYLDADIAVRHGDVNIFWDVDMQGKPAAAVRDWINWGFIKTHNRNYMEALGATQENGGYFNSGFLLIDCKEWQRLDLTNAVKAFLDEKPELCQYHDQSALNGVLAGNWAEVSPYWNWQTKVLHHILMIEARDPNIVHFNARRKPWRDRDRLLGYEFKGPMMDLANEVGWDAFNDVYSAGTMRPRKELIRAQQLSKLYNTLPLYIKTVKPFLYRTDFIDLDGNHYRKDFLNAGKIK